MIENFCRVRHDPPRSYGDCLRACIASVLNMNDCDTVPHFHADGCDGTEAHKRLNDYLMTNHYMKAFYFAFDGSFGIEQILSVIGQNNPGIYYLLQGSNGSGDHIVICRDTQIVHDPSLGVGTIIEPLSSGQWVVMLFVPLIMVSHK